MMSCRTDVVYDNTTDVLDKWPVDVPVDFPFEITDTSAQYDMILKVYHDQGFKYQNLYVKLSTSFPNGEVVDDIVSLDLRNKKGRSNGQCPKTTCNVPFVLQQNIYFKSPGHYNLGVNHHSRQDTIEGIKKLRLVIKKAKKTE